MVNIRAEDDASPEDLLGAMSEAERAEITMMKRNNKLYEDLAKSLAPGVYGHEDVKRAVLLMLLGGVHKETAEVADFLAPSLPWKKPLSQYPAKRTNRTYQASMCSGGSSSGDKHQSQDMLAAVPRQASWSF